MSLYHEHNILTCFCGLPSHCHGMHLNIINESVSLNVYFASASFIFENNSRLRWFAQGNVYILIAILKCNRN